AETSPVALLALTSALQKLPPALALDLVAILAPKIDPADPNLTRMLWFGFEPHVPSAESRAVEISLSCPDPRLLHWTARRLAAPYPLLTAAAAAPDSVLRLLDALSHRFDHHPEDKLTAAHLGSLSDLRSHARADIDALIHTLSSRGE